MRNILNELRRHNLVEKIREEGRKAAMQKLFKELKKGSQRKLAHSLGTLIENRHEDLNNRKKIQQMITKLV